VRAIFHRVGVVVILPVSGSLGALVGRKRLLIACIIVFTLASAFCGAARSLGMMIVARACCREML